MAEKKKLKRKKSLAVTNRDGIVVETIYCRRCMNIKHPPDFFAAVDLLLDKNGYFSVCKDCVSEIYVGLYGREHSLDRAIYLTCRALNVVFSESAVESTRTHLRNKEKLEDDPKVFGVYKTKIVNSQKGIEEGAATSGLDLTFQYEKSSLPEYSGSELDGIQGVVEYWGGGYSPDDYRFLERELSEWKQSYSCQNKAEEFFMRQVCLKSLDLEKARKAGNSGDSILKSLQDLLKNASLTPAQQTAASSGKGTETWGIFIKNIEETSPAEYYKDKELFKDFDGIETYVKKYILRPLKNFVTGSRDFNIVDDDNTEYDEPLEVVDEPEAGKTE